MPVPAAEQAAIAAFWSRVWAGGPGEPDGARAQLAADFGAPRAAEVEATLEPVNLRDPDVRPDPSLTPQVVFLDLPDPSGLATSANDWTRGANCWLLPERLMLLGYSGGGEVLRIVGNPIPHELQVGPDPSAPEDEQLRSVDADLAIPEAMRWTIDFQAAVDKGLGFVVDLGERQLAGQFDRLIVVGVRSASDAAEGAAELETLIRHHQATRKGFTFLPQGQPTNNTDRERAGYSWWEDNSAAFDHFHPAAPQSRSPGPGSSAATAPGSRGLVGLDRAVLADSPGYYGTDQSEARAMHVALWPATLGYYMEQMMEPVFSDATVGRTRDFFARHVLGRGQLPLFRIGRQPYGVQPATAWSRGRVVDRTRGRRARRPRGSPRRDSTQGSRTCSSARTASGARRRTRCRSSG
ncbi:MAG: hypothetical protein WDN44_07475 [Sphingomonas sp.]